MASEPDSVDALLEAAMHEYCPEPRAGFERRVLYGVRRQRRRRQLWALGFAVPVLVLLVVLLLPHPERPSPSLIANGVPARPVPEFVASTPVPKRARRRRVEKFLPFPTPSPLTEGEKALQAFVADRPEEAEKLFAHQNDKPIEIEALQIPPLQSDGGQ